jgi:hypothetical protein
MKIMGAEKLAKQLRQVPDSARVHVVKAIRRNYGKRRKGRTHLGASCQR